MITQARELNNFKCIMTNNRLIECIYIKQIIKKQASYYVAVYDESLYLLGDILLRGVGYKKKFFVPISAIHLKNEIAAYAYYIDYKNQCHPLCTFE